MEIIAVATDAEVLRLFSEQFCGTTQFRDPMLAIKHVFNNRVDYAFIQSDISRPLNVAQLVRLIRNKQPGTNIYLISEYSSSSGRVSVGEDGFIKLPVDQCTMKSLFKQAELF